MEVMCSLIAIVHNFKQTFRSIFCISMSTPFVNGKYGCVFYLIDKFGFSKGIVASDFGAHCIKQLQCGCILAASLLANGFVDGADNYVGFANAIRSVNVPKTGRFLGIDKLYQGLYGRLYERMKRASP